MYLVIIRGYENGDAAKLLQWIGIMPGKRAAQAARAAIRLTSEYLTSAEDLQVAVHWQGPIDQITGMTDHSYYNKHAFRPVADWLND